jgi:hypothetical protein
MVSYELAVVKREEESWADVDYIRLTKWREEYGPHLSLM